jgi:hypothetical protein
MGVSLSQSVEQEVLQKAIAKIKLPGGPITYITETIQTRVKYFNLSSGKYTCDDLKWEREVSAWGS